MIKDDMNNRLENDLIIYNELFIILKLLTKYHTKFCDKFNITQIQFDVLYFLYISGCNGVNMSALGKKLDIAKSGVTILVDKMILAGLVKKRPDIDDRRIIKVIITEKGNKIMMDIFPRNEVFKTSVLDFLEQEEKEILVKLIIKVKEKLESKIC